MAQRVELNHGAVAALLKSPEIRAAVNDLAHRIASAVDGDDVRVTEYTTDRAAAGVSVPAEAQARDGALTRAAAKVGLEVRS